MVEVLTWADLKRCCGSAERARTALRHGAYRRVVLDAYVAAATPDDPATRVAALAAVLPTDVALTHWTALWVLGLDVLPRDKDKRELLDVTVPRGRHLTPRPGLRPHSAALPDHELCQVEGLLAVTAERAFVDVARTYGLVEGVAAGDAALRSGATTVERVAGTVESAARLRRVTVARAALPHLEPRSESLMESRLRVAFLLGGAPRMHAQQDLCDEDGRWCGRADLFLDGVVVEYDGRESRLARDRFVHDRRRGNAFADLALEVRRFSADDYDKTSAPSLANQLRAALRLAAERRPRYVFGRDTLPRPWLVPRPTLAQRPAA